MDSYEATRAVYSRIKDLDPENASKIMGFILIQDHGEKEMIRLAFGPESLVHSIVIKARKDLGLSSSNTPTSPSSPMPFSRHNSYNSSASSRFLNGRSLPSPLSIPNLSSSNSSWAAASNFSEDLVSPNTCLKQYNISGVSNLGIGSSLSSTMNSSAPPLNGNEERDSDLIDEFQLQDQLSFLKDGYYPDFASSTNGSGCDGGTLFESSNGAPRSWGGGDTNNGLPHHRSCSVSDIFLGSEDPSGGFGWKPCLYYAKGYCKNGASCKFLHHEGLLDSDALAGSPNKIGMIEQCHELLRSKSAQQQRLAAASQLMGGSNFPYSPKCMNLFLQQQTDSPRAAAAALMMGEEMNKFSRSPRLERSEFAMDGMVNPVSRQIYLTFPADSTFKEEDVSNYFSIFGPVQDVRIPYQQKRMFGFVTFVYPDTVRLILAKGNPHFVCDARVLVKPYKEKGKYPDKFRKQHMDKGEFSSCGSPTGLDSRDSFDLQLGARMLYNSQDILWRRKLEEQAELQQAIELQNRRLMSLKLLNVRSNHQRAFSTGAVNLSPTFSSNHYSRNAMLSSSDLSSSESPEENGSALNINHQQATKVNEKENDFSSLSDRNSNGRESPHNGKTSGLLESLDCHLPHNLLSSPKAACEYTSTFSTDKTVENGNGAAFSAPSSTNLMASSLLPVTSALDIASLKSCYFQGPRFASNHGAIEM